MANELSTEQFLAKREHQASLARARSKKYYEKNKDKKIEYMKLKRAAEKKMYSDIVAARAVQSVQLDLEQNNIEDEELYNNNNDNNFDDDDYEPMVAANNKEKPPEFTLEYIQNLLKRDMEIAANEYTKFKPGTFKKYIADIKIVFKSNPSCNNLLKCVKNPKKMLANILKYKNPKSGDLYSLNSCGCQKKRVEIMYLENHHFHRFFQK
jgi:hypothetical protein